MEAALLVLAEKGGINPVDANKQWPRLAELPFDAAHKFMATFHRRADGNITVFVKGAPEVLLDLCQATTEDLMQQNHDMADTGLRVLAVAKRDLSVTDFNSGGDLFAYIENWNLLA